MSMTQEAAALIGRYLLEDFEREMATTRKVIAAIPDGQAAYSPAEKSMPALNLAFHIPAVEAMFLGGILNGAFHYDPKAGDSLTTVSEILAWYETTLPPLIAGLKQAPPEVWAREFDFFGKMTFTGCQIMGLTVKHSVHHRGQLSAYLRPMGGKVPGIYGPSGDDE